MKQRIFKLTRKNVVGYDENEALLIVAPDEITARSIAHDFSAGTLPDNLTGRRMGGGDEPSAIWLEKEEVECEDVTNTRTRGVMMVSFKAG